MKKLSVYILSFLCGLCMVFGLAFSLNTTVASAETISGATPVLSTTKYKISKSQEHMLLATGIKDYEDVYEVGYAFKDMDGITKYHAVTTKYYTSITSGNSTWTVSDMFGEEYTGMIVWEVAYDQAKAYTYQAYAKVGDRVDGNLVTTDTIIYGTRKDLNATTCDVIFDLNGGAIDGKSAVADKTVVYGSAFGELPAPVKEYASFIGWNTKPDGTGETITAETISDKKGSLILYAIYTKGLDFTTEDQINAFDYAVTDEQQNLSYYIASNSLIIKGVSGTDNLLVYYNQLKAGAVVELDVEYVTTDATFVNGVNQFTFLAYTANANGDADGKTTAVMGSAPWDGGWDGSNTTISVAVTEDCAGIRMQFVFNDVDDSYFKITGIRVLEYPLVYDFSDESVLDKFVELDHGGKEIVTEATGSYAKFYPTDMSNLYSIFFFKQNLKAGMTVEMDFELVGTIATNHGIWTWGADASGGAQFDGQFVTGWDAPTVWNGGKFTSTTNITADCYGVRIQMKYGDNSEAYWKLTSIRIINGEYPTLTITYNTTFATQEVTYGSAYGTLADAPNKAGYVFKGWYLNADGSGEAVTESTIVTTARDHALYAVYEKEQSVEEEGLEYDFSTSDQLDEFVELDHGGKEIVTDSTGSYAKFTPTDMNNLYSIFWFKKDLKAGSVVEMDFELVGAIAVNHGIWTWGADANGGAQFDGQFVTGWDAPTVWNGGKFTSTTNITADCYGVRVQMKYGDNADAYWKLTAIRVIEPTEYPVAYDFTTNDQLDEFVELDHGSKEIVTDSTGSYAKFTPTDMNNLYSIFWFKKDLKAGSVVEMDFELVGAIAVNHGIWTWGADANGGAQFDGQFVTGWDAPTVWNGGKFTSTTSITADCYGVRIQLKYGDNAEAYWKLTSIRIINGEYPTSTVTYSANGEESSASVTFGGKYSLPTATEKENAVFKGWYFNADGTGVEITSDTVVTAVSDHTVYAVYNEYYKTPNFFEENQLWNITDIENTNIHHVKDASGNYLKLAPVSAGDTTNANYPQSVFFFQYPNLTAGMAVAMDFELVCPDINSAQGIYTYEANVNGDSVSAEKCLMTAWDAPSVWNDGKFTATTEITQDCGGIRVLVRYANSVNAYWKLTGIRVYTAEEYLDIPTYADDKQIDIGGTTYFGHNATWNYFMGETGETNFAKLQEAGITMLAGTFMDDSASDDDVKTLLDLAATYGIGIFLQKSWDGSTIPSYVAHEAFLGYYVDEPAQSELASLKTLKEAWDSSAFGENGKQLYVNLLPVYSGDMGGDYDAYVKEAVETSNLPIVSYDHYMMYYAEKTVLGAHHGFETELSYRTDWLTNFDIASYYADKNDKPFWYTLLTTQHLADGTAKLYKDPTVADLTYQMYVAMTYGATNLVHYTVAGSDNTDTATEDADEIYRDLSANAMFDIDNGEWTQTYTDVKDASAIIGKWDHVFMSFDWLGTSTVTGTEAQTGLITADLTHSVSVDNYGVISSVTSTQDVVVGHFQDDNGYNGVMITNLTIPTNATAASVTVTFGDEYRAVKVYQNGEETLVYLNDGVLSLDVASAEGVFIIPVKAK